MGKEIEHKYIVEGNAYRAMATRSIHIVQGYLSRNPERTVRVRLADSRGYLTVKGRNHGDTRLEFEYEIPSADARQLLGLCEGTVIDKTRHIVDFEGYRWEVDDFHNPSFPTVAEIELKESERNYPVPPFCTKEVTGDPRYYNSNL